MLNLNSYSYLNADPVLYVLQGHLHTYRFCDNVWTFILQRASFKSEDSEEKVERVKIVACDSKLLSQWNVNQCCLMMVEGDGWLRLDIYCKAIQSLLMNISFVLHFIFLSDNIMDNGENFRTKRWNLCIYDKNGFYSPVNLFQSCTRLTGIWWCLKYVSM